MPPPLEIPIVQFPTPQTADRVLVETWDTLRANQEPIHPGTPHPNTREYPNYVFVAQVALDNTEAYVQRVWVNDRSAQNTYNAAVEYVADDEDYPAFTREYLVRRGSYAALPTLAPLTGIVAVNITAGGSGYETAPTVGFSGAGSGAAATAVVFRGAVVAIVITAEGTGYTSAPAVAFTPTNGGTGAAATAAIQPAAAVLTSQRLVRVKGEPEDSLFVRVQRVYETLPGPWVPFTRYDDDLGPIQGRRRIVANTGQAASLSATGKLTYEARDGSAIVSWEIEETWSDGTGAPGAASNPAYPPREAPIYYDNVRGSVHSHSQLVRPTWKVVTATVASGGTGGTPATLYTFTGTTGTGTKFQFTGTTNGSGVLAGALTVTVEGTYTAKPTLSAEPVTASSGGPAGVTVNLTVDVTETASLTATPTLATLIEYKPFNEFLLQKVTEYWTLPGPAIVSAPFEDESLAIITETRTLKQRSSIAHGTHYAGVDTDTTLRVVEIIPSTFGADVAIELQTLYGVAAYKSLATAKEEVEMGPYNFPGRINFNTDATGEYSIGTYGIAISTSLHDPNPSAILAKFTVKTFWVNSITRPTLTFQEFFPRSLTVTDGEITRTFNNVLFDALTGITINGFGPFNIAATEPSYAQYKLLIATNMLVDGEVKEVRFGRWKVVAKYVLAQ